MSNPIRVKSGANVNLPILNAAEFGFSTDTKQLYLGDGAANHEIAKVSWVTANYNADADVSYEALAVADLSDPTTPSVLTTDETRNKLISNYKSSGADHVFTMPAAHSKGNVIFIIGDEFQVDIEPTSGDYFYLNGVAMAADEHIQNTADTLGDQIVGMCANINGTLRWMFTSSSPNFVEATP